MFSEDFFLFKILNFKEVKKYFFFALIFIIEYNL